MSPVAIRCRIGQSTPNATLLLGGVRACGRQASDAIGSAPTTTAGRHRIRDYIHVDDLAAAHLHALDHRRTGGESLTSIAVTVTATACAKSSRRQRVSVSR